MAIGATAASTSRRPFSSAVTSRPSAEYEVGLGHITEAAATQCRGLSGYDHRNGLHARTRLASVVSKRLGVVCTVLCVTLGAAGCGVPTHHRSNAPPDCADTGGARCPGPAPIPRWVFGPITESADGRILSAAFRCGGELTASETPTTVRLTYTASAVQPGGLACAAPRLSVSLSHPLGHRTLVDATTGAKLAVG